MACGITLSTFVGLTAYVMYTKADFNFLGAGLYSCLWIMIIGSFISAFLPNMPVFNVAMAILGCITAVGYILYDTSEIINRMEIDEYVFACMSLYIDIIMLFLNLLQLLSGGKNDD
jgi:FtsH-binding integral membrane protein|tara:strand:+ start:431 stop:778 length:348 start_codon:yes stop_codon:yes gene_type:complete